jgi:hypothetical protein
VKIRDLVPTATGGDEHQESRVDLKGAYMKMRRLITCGAIAAMLVGALAATASANTVKISWVTDDFTFSEADTCGFPISWHQYGQYKVADYYDGDGVLFRSIETSGHGRYLISATASGMTLTGVVSAQIILTWSPEGDLLRVRSDGLYVGFTVPGSGIVYLDTGRIDFDGEGLGEGEILFEAGPHQLWHGDVEKFCAALP